MDYSNKKFYILPIKKYKLFLILDKFFLVYLPQLHKINNLILTTLKKQQKLSIN